MRIGYGLLFGLLLLQTVAYAEGPEIQVVDGRVTMTAQAVPLQRLLSLLDRATGLDSKIMKPELGNRTISVRFEDLELKDAVHKIFEGQPLNYMLIEGKGIRVTEQALSTGSSSSSPSSPVSSFPEPQSFSTPVNPNPIQPAQVQPPVNTTGQPAAVPFGAAPQNSNLPASTANPNVVVPGQIAPPLGTNPQPNPQQQYPQQNPLISPLGAAPTTGAPVTAAPAAGGNVGGAPVGTPAGIGLPPVQTPPVQPAGPGTIGGTTTTPGAVSTPGTLPR
jgi:hypothetical protein